MTRMSDSITLKRAVYKFRTQWNLKKINNADLQKLVKGYHTAKHTTTQQIPARSACQGRAENLIGENNQNFPQLRVGDTVRVARRAPESGVLNI
jgi:hypothetical protein